MVMKRCAKRGSMSWCKDEFYGDEDPNEVFCYYHRKVRDRLITKIEDEADFV